ncbi:MAG TPA: arginine decarboxylase [Chloroflexota bacterium]|nr:arginine decarboxylase [Chloroflexota bacterium]HUM68829.1 arginine decarboxylase [Chloroflexota bacterium]
MMANHPVIGWESELPVPEGHRFNRYLHVRHGRLHLEDLDLASVFTAETPAPQPLPSPLEIVYLPLIRRQIAAMNQMFAEVMQEVGYDGRFYYTYASKANAAEEVIRTTLGAGAHHEMSSTVDVDIAQIMIRRGLLPPDRLIVCNGFKTAGSPYAANILQLRQVHQNVIPVIEDMGELSPLITSGHTFEVGLRMKSYGHHASETEMRVANSRFGLSLDDIWKAADYIAAAPNLNLVMYHNMVGSQITDPEAFVNWLKPGIEVYARLRQRHPSLHIFNFGGGMPVGMTLDFDFDYHDFGRRFLRALQESCRRYNVPTPDVMGEYGRYTTSEHGAHLFSVITAKDNDSKLPWYIIDGSIMSSFPDSWALGEHFIVLPLNHLDKPFQQVQLGGITCDSDDVYPPKPSQSPLYLPVETEGLMIGFFSVGAYQEMLGGVRGSKHCVLPEAYELVIDRVDETYHFQILHGQTPDDVLHNLGYQM